MAFVAMTQKALLERVLADGSLKRSSELLAAGVRPQAIANALKSGFITRSAPGAYYLTEASPAPEMIGIASACARMPHALVCMGSAAYLTGLLNCPPAVTWLALPPQAHLAKEGMSPARVLRWSYAGAFEVGVVQSKVCGVPIRHTDPARTIVDLLRYARHLGGEGLGIDAGRNFLKRGGDPLAILSTAHALRIPGKAQRTLHLVIETLQGSQTPAV